MPEICYVPRRFSRASQAIIEHAWSIIAEYTALGFDLTLRQLYYQFVARALIPNRDSEYKRLGSIINDARLAGLIDWNAIQDRTRNLQALSHWDTPQRIVHEAANQFLRDKWAGQPYRPEVWIEKDALIGVIEPICQELDVPYFSCRGYTSQSEMWAGGRRMERWLEHDYIPIVLHLGDHDPSGIDMTRDIIDRLEMFSGGVEVKRLALNMDQVKQYGPPPNPAKMTDSRYIGYIDLYGEESWELDALEPQVMADLIRDTIITLRPNLEVYERIVAEEEEAKSRLKTIAGHWDEIAEFLAEGTS